MDTTTVKKPRLTSRTALRIDPEVMTGLSRIAKARGVSQSTVVRSALNEYLASQDIR